MLSFFLEMSSVSVPDPTFIIGTNDKGQASINLSNA